MLLNQRKCMMSLDGKCVITKVHLKGSKLGGGDLSAENSPDFDSGA